MDYLHGGDILGYQLRYGGMPLDFSANLNPLGMPHEVAEAARRAVGDSWAYPDPFARQLTAALAQKRNLDPESILFGNGAADLIFRLVQTLRPRQALVPAPTFAEYQQALESAGCQVHHHILHAHHRFNLDRDFIRQVSEGVDLVFVCQPNNPTGRLTDAGLIEELLHRCRLVGARLVLDESFLSFVPGGEQLSLAAQVGEHPHLLVLDSFTKLYGIAGLRLGVAYCGDPDLRRRMARCGQPWAVSTVAQAAGLAALNQHGYVAETLTLVQEQKAWLVPALESLGLWVLEGEANYLFFYSPDPRLHERLAHRGLMIRDCANYPGLGPGYYRIAIRLPEENQRLLEAIGQSLLEKEEEKNA